MINKNKLKIVCVLCSVFILTIACGMFLKTCYSNSNQNSDLVIDAQVSTGKVEATLLPEYDADAITINVSMEKIFDEQEYIGTGFFREEYYDLGISYVIPGELLTGTFEIINETGRTYKITDYSFSDGWLYYFGRIHNDAAKNAGLTEEQTAALSDDEWYQLNYNYYDLENNSTNLDILKEMFGYGIHQGSRVSIETHPQMKYLGYYLLFHKLQFTFDQNQYSVSKADDEIDNSNITIWDYINKTEENQSIVDSILYSQEITENRVIFDIGASSSYLSIGNAYIAAYADYGFTITLQLVEEPMPYNWCIIVLIVICIVGIIIFLIKKCKYCI